MIDSTKELSSGPGTVLLTQNHKNMMIMNGVMRHNFACHNISACSNRPEPLLHPLKYNRKFPVTMIVPNSIIDC